MQEEAAVDILGGSRFVVGLIGAGISSSATPALHEAEADAQGIRYAYQTIDLDKLPVEPEDVGQLLRAARQMGFRGLNITHPCKQHVLPHLDRLSHEAAAVSAVNTVVFGPEGAVGHNTDVTGFERSFKLGLTGAPLERVVVLGAGGAGAAVAYVALQLGASQVVIVDLAEPRATDLVARLREHLGTTRVVAAPHTRLEQELSESSGLIHATPTGMAAHPGVAFAPDLLRRDLWVADIVYRPLETQLLRLAREAGCRTLDGGGMAVYQAVEAFRLFTGIEPDSDRMLGFFDRVYRTPPLADSAAAAPTPSVA